ncbi:MAG: hypothetical protein M0036_17450 [Desulfobacteraceae bacterium]|nr:hypothetical protein [Desulfobacteraceae bacterium]
MLPIGIHLFNSLGSRRPCHKSAILVYGLVFLGGLLFSPLAGMQAVSCPLDQGEKALTHFPQSALFIGPASMPACLLGGLSPREVSQSPEGSRQSGKHYATGTPHGTMHPAYGPGISYGVGTPFQSKDHQVFLRLDLPPPTRIGCA